MHIDKLYKRRIRIEGKTDDLRGFMLIVHDIETGEAITNIREVRIYLSVEHDNYADVTYYEAGETGHLLRGLDAGPLAKNVLLPDPEMNLPAYEYLHKLSVDELDRSSWWAQA